MKRLCINEASRPLHLGNKIVRPPCTINIKTDQELKQFLLTLKLYNVTNYHIEDIDVEAEKVISNPITFDISEPPKIKDESIVEELDEPKTTLEKLMSP